MGPMLAPSRGLRAHTIAPRTETCPGSPAGASHHRTLRLGQPGLAHSFKELQVYLLLIISLQKGLESGCEGFVPSEDTKQGKRGPSARGIEPYLQEVPDPGEAAGVGTDPACPLLHP